MGRAGLVGLVMAGLVVSSPLYGETPLPVPRCSSAGAPPPYEWIHPNAEVDFKVGSQGVQNTDGSCIDYVVINQHPNNWLAFVWDDTPLHADPGAALAPGGTTLKSAAWVVRPAHREATETGPTRLRYGRDLQHETPVQAYFFKATPDPKPDIETRMGALNLGIEATGERVDFDLVLATAMNLKDQTYATSLRVTKLRGNVRLNWYPRTDRAFLRALSTEVPGVPYNLREGRVTIETLQLSRAQGLSFVPAIRPVLAQVWIGSRPVLEAYLPTIVPVVRR